MLRGALKPDGDNRGSSVDPSASQSELRFEHYQVLRNEDGTPMELGHGAMGVTYKAFDVHLRCPVALKIINARWIGDDSARHRFVQLPSDLGKVQTALLMQEPDLTVKLIGDHRCG
jgi:hypothetical protein